MPHTKSATKRMQTSAQKRDVNRSGKSAILSLRKRFLAAIASGDKAKSLELFCLFCSVLDKSAKKGVILENNADRRKARAAAMLAKL